MKGAVARFFDEVRSYSYYERLFLLGVMICSVCITADFATVRPVSYSVFLTHFSAKMLPYTWLLMMPFNFIIVLAYNKVITKAGCFKTMLFSVGLIVASNILGSFFIKTHPTYSFFHFIWKEIYIMLIFQNLWAIIHNTISAQRAKYLYGIIYGVGGAGSILGSAIPAFFATSAGSETLLLVSCVIYLIFVFMFKLLLTARERFSDGALPSLVIEKKTEGGFKMIKQSRYLLAILLVVVFIQLTATLMDFQFNSYLEKVFPIKDVRTAFCGRVFGIMHIVNLGLQFFGAFIVLKLFGVKRTQLLIPALFACNALAFIAFPAFNLLVFSLMSIKCCDYSIFTISKEMLYLPLKPEEKFKAKAVIDVFGSRSAKTVASCIIFLLQALQLENIVGIISWVLFFIFIVWITVVSFMFKQREFQTV